MRSRNTSIAVALVERSARILVARRHEGVHLGGAWEFPGGKIEANESPIDTALRELREECGVEAAAVRVLPPVSCDYGDRSVVITPVVCRWVDGEARPLESQECRWVTLDELTALGMPAANQAIIQSLREALAAM